MADQTACDQSSCVRATLTPFSKSRVLD